MEKIYKDGVSRSYWEQMLSFHLPVQCYKSVVQDYDVQ